MMNFRPLPFTAWSLCLGAVTGLALSTGNALADDESHFRIEEAKWESGDAVLLVKGKDAGRGRSVAVSNASTADTVGETTARRDGNWGLAVGSPSVVPCTVTATAGDASSTRSVANAPADCDGGRDTSPPPSASGVKVLASNDLGMHCTDQDFQIFSILPPFNVVHAQVMQRGTTDSEPRILSDADVDVDVDVDVVYVSVEDLRGPINTTSDTNAGRPWKTNFWEHTGSAQTPGYASTYGGLTYAPLYPSILAAGLLDPPVDLSALCGDPANGLGCPSMFWKRPATSATRANAPSVCAARCSAGAWCARIAMAIWSRWVTTSPAISPRLRFPQALT